MRLQVPAPIAELPVLLHCVSNAAGWSTWPTMMLRGPSSFQGRCLQPSAACRSVALHHRPAARCSAVSRRQAVVQASFSGNKRDKEKEEKKEKEKKQEKVKEKGKKEKENKKGKETEDGETVRDPRRGAWEGDFRPSDRAAWGVDKDDYYSEYKDESEQDRDDNSSDALEQPKGLRFIG